MADFVVVYPSGCDPVQKVIGKTQRSVIYKSIDGEKKKTNKNFVDLARKHKECVSCETAVLNQWEPKVHKMIQQNPLFGIDYEDYAQELRVKIIQSWRGYDKKKGATFHTYLHTAMVNRIRTLIYKLQKRKNEFTNSESKASEVIDEASLFAEFGFDGLIFNPGERVIAELLVFGFKKKEIKAMISDPKSFVVCYRSLREKMLEKLQQRRG